MSALSPAVSWKPAICGICPAGCWVEVGLQEGRMVDIRADTGHPLGMICRRGQHAPEIVYSENRLRHPLRRKGPKGTHEFEPVSWDQAYDLIVDRLQAIKAESGPEAVSVYTGRGAFELPSVPATGTILASSSQTPVKGVDSHNRRTRWPCWRGSSKGTRLAISLRAFWRTNR